MKLMSFYPRLTVVQHMDRPIIIFLLTIITYSSFACSCEWDGNFLNTGASGELVFKGRIIERTYHLANGEDYKDLDSAYRSMLEDKLDEFDGIGESITVEVVEVIRGSEERSRIRIFDSDGVDCRENISNFQVGSTYIFSAYKPNLEEPKLPDEQSDDYAIHGCSENWLTFSSDTNEITGKIKGNSIRRRKITWAYNKLLKEMTERSK